MPVPGQAGGQALLAKYGREYFVELGRRGGIARARNFRANIISSMTEMLAKIAEQARRNANWSSEIPNAIKVSEVTENGGNFFGSLLIDLNEAPQAAAFEYGSGIHATKGTPVTYVIKPKNAGALAFYWPGHESGMKPGKKFIGYGKDGRLMFTHVDHPGVEAKPYLHPAINQHRGEMREKLKSAFKRAFVDVGVTEITVSI
jgi:hypothetical protein